MKDQFKKTMFTTIVKLIFIAVFLLIPLLSTTAQEAVTSAGGDASGTSGSVSYTIGLIAYTTSTGSNGSVAAGVQQPYEISVSTAIEDAKDILLEFSAYPNPATDVLKLKTGERDFNDITYRLFDMNGKLIKAGRITGPETSVNMQKLSPSVYFVRVIEDGEEIKVFKIIKR